MLEIKYIKTTDNDFRAQLEQLLAWESVADAQIGQTVRAILDDVRQRGDAAVIEYTNRFDRLDVTDASELEISSEQLNTALAAIPSVQRQALEIAAERVRRYHEHQKVSPRIKRLCKTV